MRYYTVVTRTCWQWGRVGGTRMAAVAYGAAACDLRVVLILTKYRVSYLITLFALFKHSMTWTGEGRMQNK